MTDGVLSYVPASPNEEPPLWAFMPQVRIAGRLAWQARGIGERTPETMQALTGQTVIFCWRDFRRVYRLTEWHRDDEYFGGCGDIDFGDIGCGYFDAEWPD